MTVLFILPKTVSFKKSVLLLYYLYCLCKSLQRSLLYVGFLFRKADAKVKTFKYIFQIFSEVFFSSFLFPVISLAKGRTRKRFVLPTRIQEKVSTNAAYFLKAGAKVRTLFHIFQIFSEVFFHSAFFKREFQKETSPKQKKYVRVPTPFLSECQNIAAPVLESGCKSRTL